MQQGEAALPDGKTKAYTVGASADEAHDCGVRVESTFAQRSFRNPNDSKDSGSIFVLAYKVISIADATTGFVSFDNCLRQTSTPVSVNIGEQSGAYSGASGRGPSAFALARASNVVVFVVIQGNPDDNRNQEAIGYAKDVIARIG